MKNTRTLMFAAVAALSLGAATAMAQESAGGFIAGPNQQRELLNQSRTYGAEVARDEARVAAASDLAPQYGSSDNTNVSTWPLLQGGDGN